MKLFCARYLLPILAEPLEDGALLVKEGRIVAIGSRRELESAFSGAERIDFGEAILLPPCANAHTHLELTDFPRWAAQAGEFKIPASFVEWILHVIRVKRHLELSDLLSSLREGILQSLHAGTGAVGDILSCYPGHTVYSGMPLQGRVYLEILGRDAALFRPRLQALLDLADQWPVDSLTPGISPHSPYNLTSEFLEEIYSLARGRGLAASTHVAESPAEVQFLTESGGDFAEKLFPAAGWETPIPPRTSPVAYLGERGGLVSWNLLVHGVHVDECDVEKIARSRACVVLCPRSNSRLGVGRAPVGLYLRAGVPLALGTDSMASSDSLSLWDEIAFARQCFAGELTPQDLLRTATLGGAQALGLGGEMGALSPGGGAHFQVLIPPSLPSKTELEEFLCTPGRTGEVAALFLGGRDVLQTL